MQRRRLACAVALCVVATIVGVGPASEASETIQAVVEGFVEVRGTEIFPGGTSFDHVPLQHAKVELFWYEKSLFDDTDSEEPVPLMQRTDRRGDPITAYTDNGGHYTLVFEAQRQIWQLGLALSVTLEDETGLVRVFDRQRDESSPACLLTSAFAIPGASVMGDAARVTQHVVMELRKPALPRYERQPTGRFTPNRTPRNCADITGLYDDLEYTPKFGATKVGADRFGHLAAMYARVLHAAEVVRDEFGEDLPTVDVFAYSGSPAVRTMSYGPCASANEIDVPPIRSLLYDLEPNVGITSLRHEYGHHLNCHSTISGVGESAGLPHENGHFGLANETSGAALAEGLSHYLATAIAEVAREPNASRVAYLGGVVDLSDTSARVDDPAVAGFAESDGPISEELAIAQILWELDHRLVGRDRLWDIMQGNVPDIESVWALHSAIDNQIQFQASHCGFPYSETSSVLDCVFLAHGFYHDVDDLDGAGIDLDNDGIDANGDGLWDQYEWIPTTRWHPKKRDATFRRPEPDVVPGSELVLDIVDETGAPVGADRVEFDIVYDVPPARQSFHYVRELEGEPPYTVAVRVPGPGTHADVRVVKDGRRSSDALRIDGAHYQWSVDRFRPDGPSDVLGEHTFVLHPGPNTAPASTTGGPYTGTEGTEIVFDGSGSSDPDADGVTYAWDFGDGTTAAGVRPVHAYDDEGTFAVCLTVLDGSRAAGTDCTTADVENAPPVVSGRDASAWFLGQMTIEAGFADTGVVDGPWTYTIDWGDGSTTTGSSDTQGPATISESHSYLLPGTYVVQICVTDADAGTGCGTLRAEAAITPRLVP